MRKMAQVGLRQIGAKAKEKPRLLELAAGIALENRADGIQIKYSYGCLL
jgi:hypothetical protein